MIRNDASDRQLVSLDRLAGVECMHLTSTLQIAIARRSPNDHGRRSGTERVHRRSFVEARLQRRDENHERSISGAIRSLHDGKRCENDARSDEIKKRIYICSYRFYVGLRSTERFLFAARLSQQGGLGHEVRE